MRKLIASSALALAVAAPSLAAAEGLSFSAGATLATHAVFDGVKATDGLAFQPWVEGEINGFYFGVWASNLSRALTGSKYEVDLYFGYRAESGPFSYDIGYARYTFHSPSAPSSGQFIVNLGYAANEQFDVSVRAAYDPDADNVNLSGSAAFKITDKFALDATVGGISKTGHRYGAIGGTYTVNDSLSLGLHYHDTNTAPGFLTATADYAFSFR